MPRTMGRPRKRHKTMPTGMKLSRGRWYWLPTDDKSRALRDQKWPNRNCIPAGEHNDTNDGARSWWGEHIAPHLRDEAPLPDLPKGGTCMELFGRYRRDALPVHPRTKADHLAYLKNLEPAFGERRYARSEADAMRGDYLRSTDITQYLRSEAKRQVYRGKRLIADGRPVAANKEIRLFSKIFRLAKTEWGYTAYNPCLQVIYNEETPREAYHDDTAFMRVYEKASPLLQCMMDLMQMNGVRRGMLLRGRISDVTDEGLWFTLNKQRTPAANSKKPRKPKRKLCPWTDDQREVVARLLELRSKARGGGRVVDDLDTAPLFLNKNGKAVTESGFNSMWRRASRAAGFSAHEFPSHDIKAKALSDSPSIENAQQRGDHTDPRTTKRVYLRKPAVVVPLPRVSGKKAG